jgi:dihydrolipoamide dehydrogenase
MADSIQVEAVVVGSGPGGYVAGIRLGQLKIKTLVIEKARVGGVCLNVGCIPSKALIHAAKTFAKIGHAAELGIHVPGPATIDMAALQTWKEGIVNKLTSGVRQLLKGNGVQLLEGEAVVRAPGVLDVTKADGSVVRVECKHLVVATGSRPVAIPGFAYGGRVLDSTGALGLSELPKRLVVIGGGYIGLELGTVYAKLGSKVTVVEAMPTLLPGSDPECVQVVARKLRKLGVESMTSARALGLREAGDHAVVTVEAGAKQVEIEADKVLVTVGRRPNTDGADLAALGLAKDARGFITVDSHQKTSVPGVYAIGDCATGMMLAHKASREAEVAAEVIAGKPSEMDAEIPAVVFTDPEIASVGMTEEQARATGGQIKVGKYPFAALGRAMSVGETEGFAKVVAAAESGELLGVHIVGGGASDLISEGVLALEMGAFLEDLALTVHPHPTLSEAIMEAAKAALGEAIHLINR